MTDLITLVESGSSEYKHWAEQSQTQTLPSEIFIHTTSIWIQWVNLKNSVKQMELNIIQSQSVLH